MGSKAHKGFSTWEDYYKAFIALLPQVSSSYDSRRTFCDVCRIFSLSLRGQSTVSPIEKDAIESEYATYKEKYGKEGMEKIATLFSYLVEALSLKRSDFLGHVYEAIAATNTRSLGQFFTPDDVSKVMAKINLGGLTIEPGKMVSLYDPACGAGALMIESAEEFVSQGGRQGDLLLYGDDLDPTAVCIAYVQFSLLGYPAVIKRMDTLALTIYEGPWYTIGWFMHGIPMRQMEKWFWESNRQGEKSKVEEEPPEDAIDVRTLVQGELF